MEKGIKQMSIPSRMSSTRASRLIIPISPTLGFCLGLRILRRRWHEFGRASGLGGLRWRAMGRRWKIPSSRYRARVERSLTSFSGRRTNLPMQMHTFQPEYSNPACISSLLFPPSPFFSHFFFCYFTSTSCGQGEHLFKSVLFTFFLFVVVERCSLILNTASSFQLQAGSYMHMYFTDCIATYISTFFREIEKHVNTVHLEDSLQRFDESVWVSFLLELLFEGPDLGDYDFRKRS